MCRKFGIKVDIDEFLRDFGMKAANLILKKLQKLFKNQIRKFCD